MSQSLSSSTTTVRRLERALVMLVIIIVLASVVPVAAEGLLMDTPQCERLSLVTLPDRGTTILSSSTIMKLHKALRAASFAAMNDGSRALSIPPALADITPTPCVNFGRRCPVQFVAWLLENPNTDDAILQQATASSSSGVIKKVLADELSHYTHTQLHQAGVRSVIPVPSSGAGGEEDDEEVDVDSMSVPMPDGPLSLNDMVRCVIALGGQEDETPSSSSPSANRGGIPHTLPNHLHQHDLHDSVQRDDLIKAIQNLRGSVGVLMEAADRQGGGDGVLGSSPPATLPRLLPPYYLHLWSHTLSYIGFYRDLFLVPVVLAAVCSWVVVWVCYGGSRSLWAWVNTHRNSSDPSDRINMIATSIKWKRYNLLGSVHRAHIIASLLPLIYCGFIAWYLTSVFGVTSIVSLLLAPSSATASLLVVGGVGGGFATVIGGGFLVLICRGINSTIGKHRRLVEAIESTEDQHQ